MLCRLLDFIGIMLIAIGVSGIENEPIIIPLGLIVIGGLIIKASGGIENGKNTKANR